MRVHRICNLGVPQLQQSHLTSYAFTVLSDTVLRYTFAITLCPEKSEPLTVFAN